MKKTIPFAFALWASLFCVGQDTSNYDGSVEKQAQIEELRRTLAEAQRQLDEASEQLDQNYGQTLERIIEHASTLIGEASRRFHDPHFQSQRHSQSGFAGYSPNLTRPNDAYLGIHLANIDDKGLRIDGFLIHSDSTPLREGDFLVSINDVDLSEWRGAFQRLREEMQKVQVGEAVSIVVDRDGKLIEMSVPTWSRSDFGWQPLNWRPDSGQPFPMVTAPLMNEFRQLIGRGSLDLIDIQQPLANYFDVESGVLLVYPPSNQDELKAGDIILSIGDIESNSAAEVNGILGHLEKPVELTVLRKGKERKATIDPTEIRTEINRTRLNTVIGLNPGRDRLHLVDIDGGLGEYFNVDSGILVTSTRDDSELHVGDIILQIGSINVGSANQTNGILRQLNQPVQLTVRRENRTIEVMVEPLGRTHMQSFPGLLDQNFPNWNR